MVGDEDEDEDGKKNGAGGGTRTRMGFPTRPSNVRVCHSTTPARNVAREASILGFTAAKCQTSAGCGYHPWFLRRTIARPDTTRPGHGADHVRRAPVQPVRARVGAWLDGVQA